MASQNTSQDPASQEAELSQDNEKEAAAPAEQPTEDPVAKLTADLAKMRDQWIRAVAETDNIRKRAQRDQEETSRYAVTAFARDMVSVLENLKRASESIPTDARAGNELLKTLGEGVDLTLQELLGIFSKFQIKRLDPLKEKFDPNFHQAVAQVESADLPPGTVMQVVQAGYVIHDRLLRPAMVVVSKQSEAPKKVDTTA